MFTITLDKVELSPTILFMNGNRSVKISIFSPTGIETLSISFSSSSNPVPLYPSSASTYSVSVLALFFDFLFFFFDGEFDAPAVPSLSCKTERDLRYFSRK